MEPKMKMEEELERIKKEELERKCDRNGEITEELEKSGNKMGKNMMIVE